MDLSSEGRHAGYCDSEVPEHQRPAFCSVFTFGAFITVRRLTISAILSVARAYRAPSLNFDRDATSVQSYGFASPGVI